MLEPNKEEVFRRLNNRNFCTCTYLPSNSWHKCTSRKPFNATNVIENISEKHDYTQCCEHEQSYSEKPKEGGSTRHAQSKFITFISTVWEVSRDTNDVNHSLLCRVGRSDSPLLSTKELEPVLAAALALLLLPMLVPLAVLLLPWGFGSLEKVPFISTPSFSRI